MSSLDSIVGSLDSLLSSIIISDLTSSQLRVLKSNGIVNLSDYLLTGPDEFNYKFDIPTHAQATTKEEIEQHLTPAPITAGAIYLAAQLTPPHLSTGIPKLDALLGGHGLRQGELLEFYGKSSCGKSQLIHKIMSSVLYNHQESDSTSTTTTGVYFDCKNDFSPMRLVDFTAQEDNLSFLRRLRVVKESNIDKCIQVLDYLRKELRKNEIPFIKQLKLLVFDSIPTIIYPELNNRNEESQIESLTLKLRELLRTHGLFGVCINHAVSLYARSSKDKGAPGQFLMNNSIKPGLGMNWKGIPDSRVQVSVINKYEDSNTRIRLTLEKSSSCQIKKFCHVDITKHNIL